MARGVAVAQRLPLNDGISDGGVLELQNEPKKPRKVLSQALISSNPLYDVRNGSMRRDRAAATKSKPLKVRRSDAKTQRDRDALSHSRYNIFINNPSLLYY
ncbi:unnamed protein product [Caenorhabditis auriculariae]|uniref:Uncharacterized protein n=1 Tax=Caenorhabditis auriculariae TaxID=2777116 RepID=A0A8S1H990_9PELO|nr:unnamed protein product [Caenorhabditis auriculariae]